MSKQELSFATNELLFGRNKTTHIVAIEQKSDTEIEVFFREKGVLRTEIQPLQPFLWTCAGSFSGFSGKVTFITLNGDNGYNLLAEFPDWTTFQSGKKFLSSQGGETLALNDVAQQHLLRTGQTLFKGMVFSDLTRLQIEIETACSEGYESSNPSRVEDRIVAIAVSDNNGYEEVLMDDSEQTLINKLVSVILEKDPDVIEGHNIFRFDLDYISKRAKKLKVPLNIGRDKSPATSRSSRLQIAEKTINYPKFQIYGRHIVDTYLLVQFYDVSTRELESFTVKDVAEHFGFATEDHDYLSSREITALYKSDPEKLKAYALGDVRGTQRIAELLSQSYFIQTQIFGYNYQDAVVRGNATKIDSLFLREYFHQKESIPFTPEVRGYPGGFTDVFYTGLARDVWHCDIASLYPSVMLSYGYLPKNDTLLISHKLLTDLREFRLKAKLAQQNAADDAEKNHFHALQSTFKILINSFYGYLGFAQAHFADFNAASAVTAKGREIIQDMTAWLKLNGAQPIEVDTDGIYFVPPKENAHDLEKRLADTLPPGIRVEFGERYQAMFSYKAKNYALLKKDGSMIIKGATFKSRGLEKFQRDFMHEMLRLILAENAHEIPLRMDDFRKNLEQKKWDVKMFMKTDTLQDSLVKYQEKISGSARNKSAAYELAIASGGKLQPGDQVSYYVTGTSKKVAVYEVAKLASQWDPNNRDENIEYYTAKLTELYKKFQEFIQPVASQPQQGTLL